MKHLKRGMAFLLTLVMILCLNAGLPAQAAGYEPQYTAAAEKLYEMGLFKGTGTKADGTPEFSLARPATRIEGLVILIRLLGEEEAALSYAGECPFTDVPAWAEKYAAYAYAKGYTKGTSATTFSDGPLNGNSFLTFVLRALGYNDAAGDFSYTDAIVLAEKVGLIARGECSDQSVAIYRDSFAEIAFNALLTPKKDGKQPLVEVLMKNGAVSRAAVEASGILSAERIEGRYNLNYPAWFEIYTKHMSAKVAKAAAEDAVYYGLPADIRWIPDPRTEEEFINNVLCSCLVGDYSLYSIAVQDEKAASSFESFFETKYRSLAADYPELLGAYCNGTPWYGYYGLWDDDYSYFVANMDYNVENWSLSHEKVYQQQEQAKDAAYALSKKMHDSGRIREGMTQKEIAQVYYDYFCSLGVRASGLAFDTDQRGECMRYDTVYACLVNRVADCMGRCAAFNVMMHIEGISAQALQCHHRDAEKGNNHVLSRVVLDGVEYIADWGNNMPVQSIEEAEEFIEFFPGSLALARARD